MLAASWALAVAAPPKPGSQPMVPAEQQQEQQQQIPPPAEDGCRGIKLEEIADAWFEAINPLDAGDAAATCVPALVIAAGCSFNTESCPNLFDPDVKSGISNGFWLIPPSAAGAWDPTPKKQASGCGSGAPARWQQRSAGQLHSVSRRARTTVSCTASAWLVSLL